MAIYHLTAKTVSRGSGSTASPFDALTPREMEIALLLNQGMRQEAIAKRLNLSAKTVNTHKSRLFEKLAIRDDGVSGPAQSGARRQRPDRRVDDR